MGVELACWLRHMTSAWGRTLTGGVASGKVTCLSAWLICKMGIIIASPSQLLEDLMSHNVPRTGRSTE